jgi:hypothetical protein
MVGVAPGRVWRAWIGWKDAPTAAPTRLCERADRARPLCGQAGGGRRPCTDETIALIRDRRSPFEELPIPPLTDREVPQTSSARVSKPSAAGDATTPRAQAGTVASSPRNHPRQGKRWGRPPIAPVLEKRIREALNEPGRTEGVRKIAARFGVDPSTVQRISRPFDDAGVVAA